jgi:hypothetical protein
MYKISQKENVVFRVNFKDIPGYHTVADFHEIKL